MKARFNGIAALKTNEDVLVKRGKIYGNELIIIEMLEKNTGILWKGLLIPSAIRVAIDIYDKEYRISNIIVDCEENKTTFEVLELK